MESNEIYSKRCKQCGEIFETERKRATICPVCKKYNKKNLDSYRTDVYSYQKKSVPHPLVDLYKRCREIEEYNNKHGTHFSYGQYELLKFLNKI